MTKRRLTFQWLVNVAVCAALAATQVEASMSSDNPPIQGSKTMTVDQAVSAATANFYDALNVMFTGDGQPMKDAWSHADDTTYMGPNGLYLAGWEQIEQEWDAQAANKLGGRVVPQQLRTVIGADLAIITCVEVGENSIEGKKETVQIRSSTVFRNEDGTWKVIGHQTDLLGYMGKPD